MSEKKFDLGAVLASVSNSDTGKEQISYIDIDLIDDDPRNFYSTDGIDELAESIEFIGLQQPLRVRPNPDAASRYMIVSGHRRRMALRKIVDAGNDAFRNVACIIEKQTEPSAMQELRLIYANSDTRRMTSADISKQAERVEALLYELQAQGVEFPGRMRDHVAEVCKVTASKLGRLKVIRDKLHPDLRQAWDNGSLNENVAYTLARQPEEMQQRFVDKFGVEKLCKRYSYEISETIDAIEIVSKRTCEKTNGRCGNLDHIIQRLMGNRWSDCRYHCCGDCTERVKCKIVCDHYRDLAQLEKEASAAAKAAADEAVKRRNAEIAVTQRAIWKNFHDARLSAKKSIGELQRDGSLLVWISLNDEEAYADGSKAPSSWETPLSISIPTVQSIIRLADALGCSVDYLFGRTENPAFNK